MNKRMVWIGAVLVVVVMALGLVGSAAAQGPRGQQDGVRDRMYQQLFQAVVDATGLKRAEVFQLLRDGKTLAEVCTENGVDPQTVIEQVKADTTAQIEQAVTDGDISRERADWMLSGLDLNISEAMNATLPERGTPIRDRLQERLGDSLIGVLAEMAGVEPGDLLREAVTPPTLAEVAAEYGIDTATLLSETEARITENVNQAVADGKMTQEQADEVLAGLPERLQEQLNRPIGAGFLGNLRDRMPGMGGQRGGQRGGPGLLFN